VKALVAITPAAATLPTTAMARSAGVGAAAGVAAARTTAMPSQRPAPQPIYDPPNRNGLYAVLGFIAVIALVVGGVLLYNALTKKDPVIAAPTTVVVPQVIGLDLEAATQALTDAQLTTELVPTENAEVPENQVFQTDPLADTVVEKDSVVRVFFNPTKVPQAIPDVTGQNLEEAKRLLTVAGFTTITVSSETSDKPKDTVIRTDPAAAQLLVVTSPVNIVLSAGPDSKTIPNVAGQQQDAAKQFLEGDPFKFVVTVTTEPNDKVPAGAVIRTEPAIGGQLAVGSPITIVVSAGVEQVQVPPVVGLTEAQARNLITAKALTVNVTPVNVPAGDANDGRVISQSPTAGTKVAPGSAVGL
jgi:serine/threonine-protein kinase